MTAALQRRPLDSGRQRWLGWLFGLALLSAAPALAQSTAEPGSADTAPAVTDPAAVRQAFGQALAAFDQGQYGRAYAIWLPLARGGDPAAQRNIAHLYRFGLGLPQDFEVAVAWYRRAADAGLARAQANLAMMYLRGQGVEQDATAGSYWMTGAAVQGHAIAQYNLALLYLRGEGVPRNEAIATGWLFRAAQSGHAGALEALGRVVPKLSGPLGPPPPPPALPQAARSGEEDEEGPDTADEPITVDVTPPATEQAAAPAVPADPEPAATTAMPEVAANTPGADASPDLQTADSEPEARPGFLARIGQTLVDQTINLLKADQDLGLERAAGGSVR